MSIVKKEPVPYIFDTLAIMGEYMNPTTAMALTKMDKEAGELRERLLKKHYEWTFGKLPPETKLVREIAEPLLCCAESDPDINVDHNIYNMPQDPTERMKWLAGAENELDKAVEENYQKKIALLEETQPQTIIQLRNQMRAFWHADRQIKDYAKYKSEQQSSMGEGENIEEVKEYTPAAEIKPAKSLEERSRETMIRIGGFVHDEKKFDVWAFHLITDEATSLEHNEKLSEEARAFYSVDSGKTAILIAEEGKKTVFQEGGLEMPHYFKATLGRKQVERPTSISTEGSIEHGKAEVSNSGRHLVVDTLTYRSWTEEASGSDRVLDQKLTQVMVEMTMQNREITTMKVRSFYDNFAILAAAGFRCEVKDKNKHIDTTLDELKTFRGERGHKLYPSIKDYGAYSMAFNPENAQEANVILSDNEPTSWSEIIKREPILRPKTAILPEYWVKKPNISAPPRHEGASSSSSSS